MSYFDMFVLNCTIRVTCKIVKFSNEIGLVISKDCRVFLNVSEGSNPSQSLKQVQIHEYLNG